MDNQQTTLAKIVLTPDQKALAMKAAKDLMHGSSYVYEMVENDTLTIEMRDNMCNLLDHYTKEICEPLGYASAAAKRIEEKYVDIRKLNGKIHELERQLGEAAAIDTVPRLLTNLREGVSDWWKGQGFGWIHDFTYGPYGTAHIKFSFSFDHIFSMSSTPVTDKASKEDGRNDLEKKGYVFVIDEREHRLLDCDINRALLMKLLAEQFPSIAVSYWENRHVHKSDQFALWSIVSVVREIRDLVINQN